MGTWNKGDGVNYSGMTPEGEAILRKEGKWNKKEPSKQVEESPTDDLSKQLSGKKMKELQEFGKVYGASDSKKSELVEEIIEKVPDDKIKEFLEEN